MSLDQFPKLFSNRRVIGFRIYYADETTFSSKDGPWEDAPSHGIQVVVIYSERTYRCWHPDVSSWFVHNYKTLLHEMDYYWMASDGTIDMGNGSQVPFGASVKIGTWTENFQDIYNRANAEDRWE